jgi:rubrerythrin
MELPKIIHNCFVMEQTVSSIYSYFIQLFPDEKLFWTDLYLDELDHATWLSKANYTGMIDLLPSTDLIPALELVDSSVRFAEERKKQIMSRPVPFEDALNIALKLEETMVETFTNELIANVLSVDYESLSDRIIMSEKAHISKIEDMMMKRGYLQLS